MDFPAFVTGLFWVIIIAATIVAVRFFRAPSTRRALGKESRAMLLLLSIAIIWVTGLLGALKLSSWSKTYRKDKQEFVLKQELRLDEYAFVDNTFQPLGDEYRQLKLSIDGLEKLNSKINKLIAAHNNHKDSLQAMLTTFENEKDGQVALYKKVNLEIRNAMLQTATQNSNAIYNQFYNRAKVLHGEIVRSRQQVDKKLGETADSLAQSLKDARKKLTLKKHKKNEKWHIYDFTGNSKTSNAVLQLLKEEDPQLWEMASKISDEIINARQRSDQMQVIIQGEDELRGPLTKTMTLWQNAELQGLQYWGNLLYALEAMYLARQFNMPRHNPAYQQLVREITKIVPITLNQMVSIRKEVENSFISADFIKKKRQ